MSEPLMKTSKTQNNVTKGSKRRSLHSLQPISDNNKVLTRTMTTKKSDKDKCIEKTQRVVRWMTDKDSVDNDLKYWKCLAKERSKALEVALKANEELVSRNDELTRDLQESRHEKELLEAENKHLSELAAEGIKLKEMIAEYLPDD
ncbi:uncharacterized protein LOC128961338 [Oppia nitens]|uniref:uncharacterized protein LOC128961338 n=1 Tax=Oppia nitens TaxID=1686743 RepID=UPI0023DBC5F0|nr:uncharacterized protein LOC128961338 [Oppia nitens]